MSEPHKLDYLEWYKNLRADLEFATMAGTTAGVITTQATARGALTEAENMDETNKRQFSTLECYRSMTPVITAFLSDYRKSAIELLRDAANVEFRAQGLLNIAKIDRVLADLRTLQK